MIATAPNEKITNQLLEALKTCYDPEIPFNIVDLGLIYELNVDDSGHVSIKMTVTSPGCPVGPWLMDEVTRACMSVKGVRDVDVQIVFDPPWNPSMMSEEAHRALGI
ncbi:MAG: iron-sulfur cluster assembly protein [Conexivisphaerales archaeon]